jgi:hypothetical protein
MGEKRREETFVLMRERASGSPCSNVRLAL